MSFGYHAGALSKDASYRCGSLFGAANAKIVLREIEARRDRGEDVDPRVEAATWALLCYFREIIKGMGDEAMRATYKQEHDGRVLSEHEATILDEAISKPVKTTITQEQAQERADFVRDETMSWWSSP